jgi:hypothetical protein
MEVVSIDYHIPQQKLACKTLWPVLKKLTVHSYIQGYSYSRVIMDLTNIETQSVIHFHCLRGSFIFIKKNIVGFSFFFNLT